jgi:hypothetical protein
MIALAACWNISHGSVMAIQTVEAWIHGVHRNFTDVRKNAGEKCGKNAGTDGTFPVFRPSQICLVSRKLGNVPSVGRASVLWRAVPLACTVWIKCRRDSARSGRGVT